MSLQLIIAILSQRRITTPPLSGAASLMLTWFDMSSLEDGFEAEYSLNGSTWSSGGSVGENITTLTIDDLSFNSLYYIRVRAINESGDSAWLTGSAHTSPPNAVSNVVATSTSYSTISLSWNAPAILPITGYKIYKSTGGGSFDELTSVGVSENSYDAIALTGSTDYQFRVIPYNFNSSNPDALGPMATSNIETTDEAPPVIADDFNRADGSVGSDWTIRAGSEMTIVGNKLVTTSSSDQFIVWAADALAPDQYSEFLIAGPEDSSSQVYMGVWVRLNSSGSLNGYYYNFNTNRSAYLSKRVAGVDTSMDGPMEHVWAQGDTVRMSAVGDGDSTLISIYKNGGLIYTYNDSTDVIASGNPGIGALAFGPTIEIDDWKGGNI